MTLTKICTSEISDNPDTVGLHGSYPIQEGKIKFEKMRPQSSEKITPITNEPLTKSIQEEIQMLSKSVG